MAGSRATLGEDAGEGMVVFDLFVVLVDLPLLALVPALLFAGAAWWAKQRLLWIAAAAWLIYGLYELAVQQRLLCSGECNIRVDLLVIAPVLLGLSAYALVTSLWRSLRRKPPPEAA